MRRPARKGPLIPVVKVIRRPAHQFDQGVMELACGHRVRSNSHRRARCNFCAIPVGMCPTCGGVGEHAGHCTAEKPI